MTRWSRKRLNVDIEDMYKNNMNPHQHETRVGICGRQCLIGHVGAGPLLGRREVAVIGINDHPRRGMVAAVESRDLLRIFRTLAWLLRPAAINIFPYTYNIFGDMGNSFEYLSISVDVSRGSNRSNHQFRKSVNILGCIKGSIYCSDTECSL